MNKRIRVLVFIILIQVSIVWIYAQEPVPHANTPRPIDAFDTVFIEHMTWMEVRDALKSGKTTVIVSTGGTEQNGPYTATGKHNYVMEAMSEAIARKLGNALVAPIIKLVPEGNHEPPSGMMRYPGTFSLREETFKNVLIDVCISLKVHGFENVILIGDSAGNQKGMKEVAEALNEKWAGGKTHVHFIPEYYDNRAFGKWIKDQGINQVSEGIHDGYLYSMIIMTVDPTHVRMKQRLAKGLFSINGVDLSPPEKTIAMGKKAIEWKANIMVKLIHEAIAK